MKTRMMIPLLVSAMTQSVGRRTLRAADAYLPQTELCEKMSRSRAEGDKE